MNKGHTRVLLALLALIIAALIPFGVNTQVKLADCSPPSNVETNNSGLAIKSLNVVETEPLFYGTSEKVALVDHTWLADCDNSKKLTLVPTDKTLDVDGVNIPVWEQTFTPIGKDWVASLLIVGMFGFLLIAGIQVTLAFLGVTWMRRSAVKT